MSETTINLQAIVARIDRDLVEAAKLWEESQKLIAEERKLMAEGAKLDRGRWLAPIGPSNPNAAWASGSRRHRPLRVLAHSLV